MNKQIREDLRDRSLVHSMVKPGDVYLPDFLRTHLEHNKVINVFVVSEVNQPVVSTPAFLRSPGFAQCLHIAPEVAKPNEF